MRSKTIALISTAILASACGGATGSINSSQTEAPGYTSSTIANPTATPTVVPTVAADSFIPAYSFDFSITGANGTKPASDAFDQINTATMLKVRVNAGPAGHISIPTNPATSCLGKFTAPVSYSNYTANYDCVSYSISLNDGPSTSTPVLSLSGKSNQCPGAPSSAVIDFSKRLTPGHGPLKITVTGARYDGYCSQFLAGMIPGAYYNYGYYYGIYCSSTLYPLYCTHTATGSLDIQVNGSGT